MPIFFPAATAETCNFAKPYAPHSDSSLNESHRLIQTWRARRKNSMCTRTGGVI